MGALKVATHGKRYTPEYAAWIGMRRRCYDTRRRDYVRYGGRGITVCPEWANDFQAFYRDLGLRPSPSHSIDRIDGSGPYEPGNVRWATKKQQSENRCNARIVTYGGETLTLTEWAKKIGIDYYTLWQRLSVMPIAKALTLPLRAWTHRG
jgi:hypothetical protein